MLETGLCFLLLRLALAHKIDRIDRLVERERRKGRRGRSVYNVSLLVVVVVVVGIVVVIGLFLKTKINYMNFKSNQFWCAWLC